MAADPGRRRGAEREEERLDTGWARIPDQGKQCAIFALFALSSAGASFVSKLVLKAVIVAARHKRRHHRVFVVRRRGVDSSSPNAGPA